jgi:16S rRNA (guanine966-N2)-methyltransferase
MRIIGGKFKNRVLEAPKGLKTRPTSSRVKESLFNISQPYLEGANFLDLFSGSGSIGIEAISRGACFVTFIENDLQAHRCLKTNLEKFNLQDQSILIKQDVLNSLSSLEVKTPYDLVFMDPPYGLSNGHHFYFEVILKTLVFREMLSEKVRVFVEESCKNLPKEENILGLSLVKIRKYGSTHLLEYAFID